MSTIKHYVDLEGNSLGSFDGALPPAGAIEVATSPNHGLDIWNGSSWDAAIKTLQESAAELNHLYDAAIITLQNGFSDQEEKSFTEKREIIAEYEALDGNGDALGVAGLSAENIAYMQSLTGSTDNLVIVAKIVNMVKARSVSRLYSPLIEFERNTHIDQLVEGADNSAVVESLAAAYAALGG